MDDFLQKLKKVVRIVLYGPAISQSDCMKAGPYQLPSVLYLTLVPCFITFENKNDVMIIVKVLYGARSCRRIAL